jgi:tetratricopeptide (TPR) repeat protein
MGRTVLSNLYTRRASDAVAANREDEAVTYLARAKALAIGDPAPASLLAQRFAKQGKLDRTVDELRYALRLHPNNISTLLNLGYAHTQLEQYEAAERYLRKALKIMPDSLTGHSNLGLVFFRRGDYRSAAARYVSVLRLATDKKQYQHPRRRRDLVLVAHVQLGTIYATHEEFRRAIDHYKSALELDPSLIDVRQALAKLEEKVARPRSSGAVQ